MNAYIIYFNKPPYCRIVVLAPNDATAIRLAKEDVSNLQSHLDDFKVTWVDMSKQGIIFSDTPK